MVVISSTSPLVYNSLEGLIAVAAGLIAGSIALVGFGFDDGKITEHWGVANLFSLMQQLGALLSSTSTSS